MRVGDICNRDVAVIERQNSLFEAARRMREAHVGSLVVVDKEEGRAIPVGILTDRDILIQVICEDISAKGISAEDIMATDLMTVHEDDGVFETIEQMHQKGIRRMPIVDDQQNLVGILTLDDLLEVLSQELRNIAEISSLGREQEMNMHP